MAQNVSPANIQELLREENQREALKDDAPLSFWQIAVIRIRKDRLTMTALSVLLFILVVSLLTEPISNALGVDPFDTNLLAQFERPSFVRVERLSHFPHNSNTHPSSESNTHHNKINSHHGDVL